MEYSSNAKGNLGVTLGAVGTGLSVLGGMGGLLGVANNNTEKPKFITKDEFDLAQQIAAKDSEIALLKSEQNTEIKISDVYERIMTRVNQDQRDQAAWNANQSVANAQITAAIATNNASITALQNCCNQITKLIVPATAVCPQPMPQYNSWTAPNAG